MTRGLAVLAAALFVLGASVSGAVSRPSTEPLHPAMTRAENPEGTIIEARRRMSFVPGERSRHAPGRRFGRRHGSTHYGRRARTHFPRRMGRDSSAHPAPQGHVPPGFKMEDGVLTYPAPARFQPKNLKHR